ncbi:hypothetical protein [Kitasatospora sp. NPDC050467]|uniref:hypothetical protein n=1 Tax=unclassified Kitasatospora TaxID=2633591 RepID=UPI003246A9C5
MAQLGQELQPHRTDQRMILHRRETVDLRRGIDDQRSAWGRHTGRLPGTEQGPVDEDARRHDHRFRVQRQLMDATGAEVNDQLAVAPLQIGGTLWHPTRPAGLSDDVALTALGRH